MRSTYLCGSPYAGQYRHARLSGAGGALSGPRVHFVELRKGEVRRIVLPRTRVDRKRLALPAEVAELAALEPAQHLLEGLGPDAHVAPERVVQRRHREEHQP